jgi:Fe-S cluster assembly ATPase SufC
MANPIYKHFFMKNQKNLSGVNLNIKHDEANSLKSPNGSSVGKKKFKETCFVYKK